MNGIYNTVLAKLYKLFLQLFLPIALISTYLVLLKPEEFHFVSFDYYFQIIASISLSIILILRLVVPFAKKVSVNIIDVFVALFFIYITIYIIFDEKVYLSNPSYLSFVLIIGTYIIAKENYNAIADKNSIQIFSILFVGLIQTLVGVFQYLSLFENLFQGYKIGGSLGNPGPFGVFITCFFILNLSEILNKKHKNIFYKIFLGINGSLMLLAIVLSNSRTSWIACIVGFGYLLFVNYRNSSFISKYINSLKVKVILIISLLVFTGVFSGKLYNYKKESAVGRLLIWENTLQIVKDNPLFGAGYKAFNVHINDYQAAYFENNPDSPYKYLADDVKFAFNDYLQLAANLGLTGLIIFFAILGTTLLKKQKNESYDQSDKSNLIFAFRSIIIVIAVSALFSYPFRLLPVLILLFFAFGIISGSHSRNITFPFSKTIRLGIFIILLCFSIFFNYYSSKQLKNSKQWYQAHLSFKRGDVKESLIDYQRLAGFFNNHASFNFNYAAHLMKIGKHKDAIQLFNSAANNINSYDYNLRMGKCYQENMNYEKAEYYYKKASLIIPCKLYPKYLLIILYQKYKSEEFLTIKCEEFLESKSKFYTEFEGNLKTKVTQILNTLQ